jgi:diaminopimelate decarboxylase
MPRASAPDDRFRLDEVQARELAAAFGTPLYVLDEDHFRAQVRRYRAACEAAWPGGQVAFASKANSTLAVLAIAAQEGCLVDVASEGELRAALAAGVPAERCHLHGNNKTVQELAFAIEQGVSEIVVDNFGEIEVLTLLAETNELPDLVLRLAPGVDPVTHHKISTGQADTKFGFNLADGSAEEATLRCLRAGLPLAGFHCHVGSQLLDPEAQVSGGELIAQHAAEMRRRHGFSARILNVGGGLGVRYLPEHSPTPVEDYCRTVAEAVRRSLEGTGLEPTLIQEPGRALVAESGVTLYSVGVVKTVPTKSGPKTYVCVDGGLSDNPRPALYDAPYQIERVAPAAGSAERGTFTVSGKHCETDLLFPAAPLPKDIRTGDLVQVLCTGAYNSSMASNYNRYPRPATALIRPDGTYELVQRRDTWAEMVARESVPADILGMAVKR